MRYSTRLRRDAPTARAQRGRTTTALVAIALPLTAALALVATALVAGATFAVLVELVPTTLPTLLVGWVSAIGLAFALPLVAVRAVVTVLERLQ